MAFQKVNGLKTRYEIVEYRSGNSKESNNIKMPLSATYSDVVLQRGMFAGDLSLFRWLNEIKLNTIARQTITIELLNEEHNSMFVWTLTNAFPREITFGEFDAMKASFAIEELVIAHEGLSMELSG